MATTAGFRQQCPSCEALVPIRDASLVGRKIDCPKCKYRFVVEDPGDVDEPDEAEAAQGKVKKGRDDAKQTKGKTSRRRDEEDDEQPAGAKPGNKKLLVGISVAAAAAVIILGVVAYYVFFNNDSPTPSRPSGGMASSTGTGAPAPPSSGTTTPSESTKEEKTEGEAPAAGQPSGEFLCNMLPGTAEGICAVKLSELRSTGLGRVIFDTPGAFNTEMIKNRLGITADDMDYLVLSWNFRDNWSLTLMHFTKPLELDGLKAAIKARAVNEKEFIDGQEYYLLDPNPWMDQLGRSTLSVLLQNTAIARAAVEPKALRVHDSQTLVLGDLRIVKEFLQKKGKWPELSQAPPKEEEQAAQQPSGFGMPGGMGMGGGMGGGAPGRAGVAAGGGGPGGGSGQQQQPRPGGGGPPFGQPQAPAEPVVKATGNYLTVRPDLKQMMDRLEVRKPVVSVAVDGQAMARARISPLTLDRLNLKVLFQDANVLGAALATKEGIGLSLSASLENDDVARRRLKALTGQDGKDLADHLTKVLLQKVELIDEDATDQGTSRIGGAGGAGGANLGAGGPRGMMGMMGGMQQRQRPGGAGAGVGVGAGGGGGAGAFDTPFDPTSGGGQAGRGGTGTQSREPAKPSSKIQLNLQEKVVVMMDIDLIDQSANSNLLAGPIRQEVMRHKGYVDMAGNISLIHHLARAAYSYPEQHNQMFPRGTVEREIPRSRANRSYGPDQRVGWLAELLPYLGPDQASLASRIDRNRSWREAPNLDVASTLIPQFLDPAAPQSTWWVRYPGLDRDVATTHFVGIGGVGHDASEYDANDPTMANKLGILGYDRQTRVRDISDKTSNTILLIQVPPTVKRPWLAGGGATVVGVPEKNSIRPFISVQRDGKRGTHALMADGSVRFISENISDEAFKALSTIKGNEQSFILNRDAPEVPAPEPAEEKKSSAPSATKAPPNRN